MSTDLVNIITTMADEMRKDRGMAQAALQGIPKLLTEGGDVLFDIDPPISVPSIKKLYAALTEAGLTEVSARVAAQERLSINLIQESERLAQKLGASRVNPSWRPIDMSAANADGETSNPLYRANVENGLRFPFDGYSVRRLDRLNSSGASRIGSWLLPNYQETTLSRTMTVANGAATSSIPSVGVQNVFAANAFATAVTYTYNYWYWHGYYGYYWYWYGYYGYYSYYSYTYTTYQQSKPSVANLSGYAHLAQSFQTEKPQVLIGAEIGLQGPGAQKVAAQPKVFLVRCKQGMPVLSDVVCEGSFRDDSTFANTNTSIVSRCRADFSMPVHVKAGEQLALVISAKAAFSVLSNGNTDNTGQMFVCQDAYFWVGDATRDIQYSLIAADFGAAETKKIIDINPLELSGGISSAKLQLVQQGNQNGNVDIEVQLNNSWQPLSVLENNIDLPPYTPARMVMKGDRDVFPLVNLDESSITVFRPSSKMSFISKPRNNQGNVVKLVFESAGFDPVLHKVDYQIVTKNGTQTVPALTQEHSLSSDSKVRTSRVNFKLPDDADNWQLKITGETQNPARLFDIISVVELV